MLLPFARSMNLELIWLHGAITETTMKYQLNRLGVPCIVVEMGIGMRLTAGYVDQLMIGVLHMWRSHGVLAGDVELPPLLHQPRLLEDSDIRYLNAPTAGMFVPLTAHGAQVLDGELLGHILSPHQGKPLAEVRAPAAGRLFTLREFPLVYEGSLMGRIAVAGDSA